ncbi:MAG: twin-arginine translocation pathway signal protein, partial [Acidobacteria bacterium]|nr:twin-arginine translocation pathway signal protein [Acidobacteriota bacterium]
MKRTLCFAVSAAAVAFLAHLSHGANEDLAPIEAEVAKRHDESVKRLSDWIKQVSIAAEDRGFPEGAEHMAQMAREAGFQRVEIVQTKGKPGVFATLDA